MSSEQCCYEGIPAWAGSDEISSSGCRSASRSCCEIRNTRTLMEAGMCPGQVFLLLINYVVRD
jgi:hypothetical protein